MIKAVKGRKRTTLNPTGNVSFLCHESCMSQFPSKELDRAEGALTWPAVWGWRYQAMATDGEASKKCWLLQLLRKETRLAPGFLLKRFACYCFDQIVGVFACFFSFFFCGFSFPWKKSIVLNPFESVFVSGLTPLAWCWGCQQLCKLTSLLWNSTC